MAIEIRPGKKKDKSATDSKSIVVDTDTSIEEYTIVVPKDTVVHIEYEDKS